VTGASGTTYKSIDYAVGVTPPVQDKNGETSMLCTELTLVRRLVFGTTICLAATAAFAKGKPTPPPPPTPPVQYDVMWFNTGGEFDDLKLYRVNQAGTTVVGRRTIGGVASAISLDVATGTLTDLNSVVPVPAGWHLDKAQGINSLGQIAGTATDNLGIKRVFDYDPSNITTPFRQLSTTGTGDQFRDMNESGDVLYRQDGATPTVYLYTHDDQDSHALPSSLGTSFGGDFGSFFGPGGPVALNNNRLIAGNIQNSFSTAYTYQFVAGATGTTTAIPPHFKAIEINDAGTVVGSGNVKVKGTGAAAAITYNALTGKKQLTDVTSYATAINELGQVAGEVYPTSNGTGIVDDAFIYDPVAKFWRISGLIQDPADLALWKNQTAGASESPDIQGMSEPLVPGGYPLIVGARNMPGSMFPDGVGRQVGFILTPIGGGMASALVAGSVPEPTSAALLVLALLSLATRRGQR
jgi:hypothetical protein